MNDISCAYTGDREAALMAYLYEEITPAERAAFDGHLAVCARCRTELAAFGGVRKQLTRWTPPAFGDARSAWNPKPVAERSEAEGDARPDASSSSRANWRSLPAWTQAAAAMLFVGIAAGIANLDIHYDARNGLNVRTGWSRPSSAANLANPVNAASVTTAANPSALASRSDLSALERQLRAEMRALQTASAQTPSAGRAAASNDAEVLRQVKALIEQSERRQQSELALRVAAFANEVNAQRQADLRKIDMSLGRFQDSTGVEVLRNRQKLDYLLQRVSQQQ